MLYLCIRTQGVEAGISGVGASCEDERVAHQTNGFRGSSGGVAFIHELYTICHVMYLIFVCVISNAL